MIDPKDDPVRQMFQNVVDTLVEEAKEKGLTLEEYLQELKEKLDKQE